MRRLLILAMFFVSVVACAEDWGPLQFLVGRWTGDGSGAPGQGTGSFSFAPDLQGKVLVRRSFAEYPPANGKPAYRHDDLMIAHREGSPEQIRAIYFDNEGHVIHYAVKPAANGVVFLSEGPSNQPRYRLTYTNTGTDRLTLKFEIAPPGKDFAPYIEATAHRER